MTVALATGPADIRDQRWLAERVEALGNGIEAARDIWANWFDGRCVSRFHPDMTPGQYIASLGLRLTLPEGLAAMPDASPGQVAAVTGLHRTTVMRERERQGVQMHTVTGADGKTYPARTVTAVVIDEPREDVSIDDALWDALMAAIDAISGLAGHDATSVAATVPDRRRAATARRLRKLGTYLGRIAWVLEGSDEE